MYTDTKTQTQYASLWTHVIIFLKLREKIQKLEENWKQPSNWELEKARNKVLLGEMCKTSSGENRETMCLHWQSVCSLCCIFCKGWTTKLRLLVSKQQLKRE